MLYLKGWNVTEVKEEYGYDPVYERLLTAAYDGSGNPEGEASQEDDNLVNEVHPIFAPTNFPGLDYEIIKPSHGDGEDDWHWACFPTKSQLSLKDKAMVRYRLRTMASMVSFVKDSKLKGALCQPAEAQLHCSAPYTYGDFSGACSTIYYDETIVTQLSRLDPIQDPDSFERFHLDFARLLVHEVAHAAHRAAWNVQEEPCAYATMSEAGYDWKAATFGGTVDTFESEHATNHLVNQWPNGCIGKKYLKEEWSIWIQDICPDVDVAWEIPYFYVRKLFTTSFWEQTVPVEGAPALKVPKLRGHLHETDDEGRTTLQRPLNMDRTVYEQSLPEDCCIDDAYEGTMRPFAPGVEYEGFGRLLRIDTDAPFPPDPCFRAWQIEHPSAATW